MSERPLPSSFDENDDFYNESGFSKVMRKLKKEPLVPIGCLLTVAAFTNAYRAMRRGDHASVQRMFRARVAAQGFTVAAMVAGGMYFSAERHRERELWKLQRDRDEEEKRQRWIRELEVRDEEDRAVRERLDRRRRKAEGRRAEGRVEAADGGDSESVPHASTGTKGSKETEGASDGGKPQVLAQAEAGDELLSIEKKEGTGLFGGWFGSSQKSEPTPDDPKSDPEARK